MRDTDELEAVVFRDAIAIAAAANISGGPLNSRINATPSSFVAGDVVVGVGELDKDCRDGDALCDGEAPRVSADVGVPVPVPVLDEVIVTVPETVQVGVIEGLAPSDKDDEEVGVSLAVPLGVFVGVGDLEGLAPRESEEVCDGVAVILRDFVRDTVDSAVIVGEGEFVRLVLEVFVAVAEGLAPSDKDDVGDGVSLPVGVEVPEEDEVSEADDETLDDSEGEDVTDGLVPLESDAVGVAVPVIDRLIVDVAVIDWVALFELVIVSEAVFELVIVSVAVFELVTVPDTVLVADGVSESVWVADEVSESVWVADAVIEEVLLVLPVCVFVNVPLIVGVTEGLEPLDNEDVEELVPLPD